MAFVRKCKWHALDKFLVRIFHLAFIVNSCNECRYECIENDLLGSINLGTIHGIAPYKSKGIERASELQVCWSNKANNTGKGTISTV